MNFKKTKHVAARQSQRGITSSMVDYVAINGIEENDKIILGRKEVLQLLAAIKDEERLLMKILDKGGVVVVAEGDSIITTYNRSSRRSRAARSH
ncbi:DUF4258 domain-containing protein [Sapientia aquatica]|uniref:DUF4258 domain-containing protein n=1 Tax=Sapientia aquatica TaxID=1549640 RepID=A0A4R5VRD8_9BURK|nr:DUF4258 domain-containing protein [Sapientia aquatica]TDK61192.1 DUF4258 domain-containing protein [Sapientia aquatica]